MFQTMTRSAWNATRLLGYGFRLILLDLAGVRRKGRVAINRGFWIDPRLQIELERDVWIGVGCVMQGTGKIMIAEKTYIGASFSAHANAIVTIGERCMLGNFVSIIDSNHGMNVGADMQDQPLASLPVTISRNCWLGEKCTILPGVTIGEGAVVAAAAVVTKDVPPNAIVAGVPARVIRFREPV